MLYFLCYCNKYNEIKMCDLEPFSEIRSHIIMKVISFNDSSIQACRLGKALLTYTKFNCVVGAPMYTKGLVLRIEVQYNSFSSCYFYITLIKSAHYYT